MFLICLLLISLFAIASVIEQVPSNAKQAEFILVPVRVKEKNNIN